MVPSVVIVPLKYCHSEYHCGGWRAGGLHLNFITKLLAFFLQTQPIHSNHSAGG